MDFLQPSLIACLDDRICSPLHSQLKKIMHNKKRWIDAQPLWDVIKEGHATHVALVKQQQSYEVHGFNIEVLPGVYHCHEHSSSRFFLRHLPLDRIAGKSVIEIGCGSGLIGMYAATNGAHHVVMGDIAQSAVDCAKRNLIKNNLFDVEVLRSDLFAAFDGHQFDVILFNPPFYNKSVTDEVEGIFCDPGMKVQKQFIADCEQFLAPGGVAIFTVSNIGNPAVIKYLLEHIEILGMEFSEESHMSMVLLAMQRENIPTILKLLFDENINLINK